MDLAPEGFTKVALFDKDANGDFHFFAVDKEV